MRPPLNAGENAPVQRVVRRIFVASMRPPLNAGENRLGVLIAVLLIAASMRPPLNAGENSSMSTTTGETHALQ